MRRLDEKWLFVIVLLLSGAVFIADMLSPIGRADYVFYFLPVSLTFFQNRGKVPHIVALLVTILAIVGFYFSPSSNFNEGIAVNNRVYTIIVVWVSAFLVGQGVNARNAQDKNNWVKTGLTSLAQKIRGELSLPQIGEEALDFLSDYTGSKAGTVYLKRDGATELEFLSGHAFGKNAHSTIRFGEGFVGQAAASKEVIEIDNAKETNFHFFSSLAEGQPRSLHIVPLQAEGDLVGVMELAFLTPPASEVSDLLDDTCELMGVSLRSSQHKSKLAKLLEESQRMTRELQTQQEELRVVNEELEQQSKALKDSHSRLENQQAELEQTNQQLEEQAQKLEQQTELLDASNRHLRESKVALEEKTRELEKSSRYKSEFMANMSHELRTPLNSSLILAKLLSDNKEGNLTEEQIKYAQVIHSSGNDLLNLINDILDLSKVEAGKLTIHPVKVRLPQIKHSLEQTFLPLAQEKKIAFKVNMEPGLPEEITTDSMRLEQILKNLLSNAIKFTGKGSVTLTMRKNGHEIDFVVQDTGVGIKPEQQEVIFEAFRQADGTTNRKFGGTGLGLSISKELTRILGGHITVSSKAGEGSTFTLHLPEEFGHKEELLQKADVRETKDYSPKTPEAPRQEIKFNFKDDRDTLPGKKRKILIIEDDEPFAKILFDVAHEMGFAALVSPTATEGLRLAREFIPDAVVLDIRLPDHSGLIVLDQLKQNPRTRHIPVHVVSSSDQTASAKEMGAVGYAIKPVKIETLKTVFQNITSFVNQTKKHVLVVEDDSVQRKHIVDLISDGDVKVDAVENAKEALERLSMQTYDCMIMDLSLPDYSGFELLSKLSSEQDRYSYPPVIVYTARDLTRTEEERLRQYSGSIIIKGAKSPERLLSEVTLFLHRVETDLPPERQKMLKDLRSREKGLEDRTILAVDDDVRNIFALTSVLEQFGAKIIVARNGKEALERLETHPEVDLVLMDIMMPEMDGYEAITRIRNMERFASLPIIALTAKTMKDDQVKCLSVGANDYLAKPLDVDKLMSLIRVWLPTKRSFHH